MNALNYIQDQPKHYLVDNKPQVMHQANDILSEFISDQSPAAQDNLIGGIERETQLVINQLSRLKDMHKQTKDKFLQQECQICNDLERLHPLGADASRPSDPQRAQLKARLGLLDDKRQRLEMDYFDRQNRCLEKLVLLTSRHKLLNPNQNP